MRMTDKQLGYATVAVVLLACLLVTWQMHVKNAQGALTVQLLFPEVGALQPQDPVVERGVPVGRVRSIEYAKRHGQAVVTVDFDTPVKYSTGTQFINSNYSLMGQRLVTILPSHKGEVLDLRQPQQGVFEPGIAEAMHLMEQVVLAVDTLKQTVQLLATGSANRPPLVQQINRIIASTEQTLGSLGQTLADKTPVIIAGLQRGNRLAAQGIRQADSVQAAVIGLASTTSGTIASLDSTVARVSGNLGEVALTLDTLTQSPGYVALMEHRDLFERLIETRLAMQGFLNALRTDEGAGFAGDGWILWKKTNWNVFGATAREKRLRPNP